MSSSTQSTRRSASTTSYTYGFPGSQVTINLKNNGNHSLTLSRGPNTNSKPFCKVCYDAGLPVADYTDHFVKDQPGPNGKVVCPTLLAQKCLMCGVAGHTSSYCPEEARLEREFKERERQAKRTSAYVNGWKVVGGSVAAPAAVPVAAAPIPIAPACRGSFGILAVDEPSDDSEYEREQEEIRNTPANVPKPVAKERPILTGPPSAVEPAKPLTWAQRAAAAATKPSSTPSTSAPVQTSLIDTRFHLHSLCHQIEMSSRAPCVKKLAAASAENHRGNAAAVARESSLKRKQESVTIPA